MSINHNYFKEILNITREAEDKIYNSNNIISDFSELLRKYWW